MPQAANDDCDVMRRWFGSIDLEGPIRLLESRGWEITRQWNFAPPVSAYTISDIEHACIIFLQDEWDFGGVVGHDRLNVKSARIHRNLVLSRE